MTEGSRRPDFFLDPADGGDQQELRTCWVQGRLRNSNRDDFALVLIEPPLIGQPLRPGRSRHRQGVARHEARRPDALPGHRVARLRLRHPHSGREHHRNEDVLVGSSADDPLGRPSQGSTGKPSRRRSGEVIVPDYVALYEVGSRSRSLTPEASGSLPRRGGSTIPCGRNSSRMRARPASKAHCSRYANSCRRICSTLNSMRRKNSRRTSSRERRVFWQEWCSKGTSAKSVRTTPSS